MLEQNHIGQIHLLASQTGLVLLPQSCKFSVRWSHAHLLDHVRMLLVRSEMSSKYSICFITMKLAVSINYSTAISGVQLNLTQQQTFIRFSSPESLGGTAACAPAALPTADTPHLLYRE